MAGGKKRGAGTDSSGRGDKKRSVGASPGSSSGSTSNGRDRPKVNAETKKMDKALENSHNLSRACKQHTIEDVDKITWKLKTDEEDAILGSYADFKGVLDARRDCFKKVRSTLIHGVAVTQPKLYETYHIVNIEVDSEVVLQLLFRHSDGYLVAFRRVSTENSSVWEGWFYFKDDDITLPSFCKEQVKMDIESGYNLFSAVRFGKRIVSSIVKCLLAFTKENCALHTYGEHNRILLFETLMVFFGECQRSGIFLEFAERHFESDTLVQVTKELSKHRNSWINLSRVLMALYLGYLYQKHRLNGWEAEVVEGEWQITQEIEEFTCLGHLSIERFIVYEMVNDKRVPNYSNSMQSLLGSNVGQLLHLIKYDEKSVQKIHFARMKAGVSEEDD